MKKIKYLLSIIIVSIFMFTFSGCEKEESSIMGIVYLEDAGVTYTIEDATVELYSAKTGLLVETTTTDAAGRYQFDYLWDNFWDVEVEVDILGITFYGEQWGVYTDGTTDKIADIYLY